MKAQISSELVGGVPFISDAQLQTALADAGVPQADADAIAEINATARLEALQVAFALVGLVAIGALFITARIPTVPPGAAEVDRAGSEGRRQARPRLSGGPEPDRVEPLPQPPARIQQRRRRPDPRRSPR